MVDEIERGGTVKIEAGEGDPSAGKALPRGSGTGSSAVEGSGAQSPQSGVVTSGGQTRPSRPSAASGVRNGQRTSVEGLLRTETFERACNADLKLRQQLSGSVLLVVSGQSGAGRYFFDLAAEKPRFEVLKEGEPIPGSSSEGSVGSADCTINISGDVLLRIASGDLNPQIAMLSDKVQLEGRPALAIYFFNLVVPGGFVA